jgi:hypothetical protein
VVGLKKLMPKAEWLQKLKLRSPRKNDGALNSR